MPRMEKSEEESLLRDNPHLQKYIESIQKKMDRPAFFDKVSRDLKGEKYPNIIYLTREVVFIHIFRTKDMEDITYHAVEPILNEREEEKRDKILEIMYERAHLRTNIKTQNELRKAIEEYERLTTFNPDSWERFIIHPEYHYRLAKLYEENADLDKAIREYNKFLTIWKNADKDRPELIDAHKRLTSLKENNVK